MDTNGVMKKYKIKIKNPVMGVPISYFSKHCPTQFEIVGITENADYLKSIYIPNQPKYDRPYINGKAKYSRLLIKKIN